MKPTEQILKEWKAIADARNLGWPHNFKFIKHSEKTYDRLLEALGVANAALKSNYCECVKNRKYICVACRTRNKIQAILNRESK